MWKEHGPSCFVKLILLVTMKVMNIKAHDLKILLLLGGS